MKLAIPLALLLAACAGPPTGHVSVNGGVRVTAPAGSTSTLEGDGTVVVGPERTRVVVRDGRLTVNGVAFGSCASGDSVTWTGSQVLVNGEVREPDEATPRVREGALVCMRNGTPRELGVLPVDASEPGSDTARTGSEATEDEWRRGPPWPFPAVPLAVGPRDR